MNLLFVRRNAIMQQQSNLRQHWTKSKIYNENLYLRVCSGPVQSICTLLAGGTWLVHEEVFNWFMDFPLSTLVIAHDWILWLFFPILNLQFDCRTPFELNTLRRCVAIAVLQMFAVICALTVIGMVVFLFIEFSMYTEACILDVKSIFVKIDGLAGGKKSELQMIAYCKESVLLHERINRYIFSTY